MRCTACLGVLQAPLISAIMDQQRLRIRYFPMETSHIWQYSRDRHGDTAGVAIDKAMKHYLSLPYSSHLLRRMYLVVTIAHSGLPRRTLTLGGEVMFERGSGGIVIDADGREYIDFILGYGSVILGHGVAGFRSRLESYSENGILLPGYSSWHIKLLQRLLQSKAENYSAAFFKTGSESVTAAIRLASRLSSKKGIIRCGFIGWHDAQLGKSVRWHEPLESPLRFESRFVEGFRGVAGEEEVFNWASLDLKDFVSIINANSHKIGCLVIDTYQLRFAGSETLKKAIDLCKDNGIYVVADETKIVGRVSRMGFATELGWDVDFLVVGKALANGAPMSILLGRPDLMLASEESRITGTFSQELSAVFSALATLDEMERLDGYAVIRSIGLRVTNEFNAAARQVGIQDHVQAESLFGGEMFELKFSNKILGNWNYRQNLCSMLADQGVLLLQGHASYVCLEHGVLAYDVLRQRFERGLAAWKSARPSCRAESPLV
jgi:glutamate-1-semialdehyde 2,1-aminomutase